MALQVASPDITGKAKKAEHEGDLKLASTLYEQVLKQYPIDEFPYTRLMIVYRKMKQYKDELRVINKGIKNFEAAYNKRAKKPFRKNSTTGKLSTAFMKSAGLTDKKGNAVYEPQPVARWKKRKLTVEKKLK